MYMYCEKMSLPYDRNIAVPIGGKIPPVKLPGFPPLPDFPVLHAAAKVFPLFPLLLE
jgi:hypothetical protein